MSNATARAEDAFLKGGTPAYRRAALAMFAGGFATFALLGAVLAGLPAVAMA